MRDFFLTGFGGEERGLVGFYFRNLSKNSQMKIVTDETQYGLYQNIRFFSKNVHKILKP